MSSAPAASPTEGGDTPPERGPRPPTMLDALLPIVVLIALLALTIALFGIDATNGPLQVALLLSAAFASLMAFMFLGFKVPMAAAPWGDADPGVDVTHETGEPPDRRN